MSLLLFVVTSTRDYKTNYAISNLNQTFWNKSTQQIKSTTSSTDLCFNKKFEQEKKRLYKISISKSIDGDTYYVVFVIIVPECDVLSNIIFFLTSQKGRSIASVNYLKVKNDVPDRNQIQTAPNFLFLSSYPANIRLDEDVLKTSFVFVFRRPLEDVFKTSWSRRICSP